MRLKYRNPRFTALMPETVQIVIANFLRRMGRGRNNENHRLLNLLSVII